MSDVCHMLNTRCTPHVKIMSDMNHMLNVRRTPQVKIMSGMNHMLMLDMHHMLYVRCTSHAVCQIYTMCCKSEEPTPDAVCHNPGGLHDFSVQYI